VTIPAGQKQPSAHPLIHGSPTLSHVCGQIEPHSWYSMLVGHVTAIRDIIYSEKCTDMALNYIIEIHKL